MPPVPDIRSHPSSATIDPFSIPRRGRRDLELAKIERSKEDIKGRKEWKLRSHVCGPVGARVAEYGNVSFYARLGIHATRFFPRNAEIPWRRLTRKASLSRIRRARAAPGKKQACNYRESHPSPSTHRDPLESSESITVNSCFFLSSNYSHRVTGKKTSQLSDRRFIAVYDLFILVFSLRFFSFFFFFFFSFLINLLTRTLREFLVFILLHFYRKGYIPVSKTPF